LMAELISSSSSDTSPDAELVFVEAEGMDFSLFPWHSGHAAVSVGITVEIRDRVSSGCAGSGVEIPFGMTSGSTWCSGVVWLGTGIVGEDVGVVPSGVMAVSTGSGVKGELVGVGTVVTGEMVGCGAIVSVGRTVESIGSLAPLSTALTVAEHPKRMRMKKIPITQDISFFISATFSPCPDLSRRFLWKRHSRHCKESKQTSLHTHK
jgi:hypothetical protein